MKKNFDTNDFMYPQPVLIVAGYDEKGIAVMMNATWGGVAERKQIALYINADYKTVKNMLNREAFTVSMADEKHVEELEVIYTNGNPDKLEKAGFHTTKGEFVDAPMIEELPLTMECKLVNYDEKSKLLLGEIVNICADETMLNAKGKIDPSKLWSIVFNPTNNVI